MPFIYERAFHSELGSVRPIIVDCLEFIRGHSSKISVVECFEVKLILSELLYNAVIHGNRYDKRKRVILKLELTGDKISVLIKDEGEGFDCNSLLQSFQKNENLFGESGRGLRLVCKLVDDLNFSNLGNEITFTKRIG